MQEHSAHAYPHGLVGQGEWTCLVGEGHLVVGVGLTDLVGVGLSDRLARVGAELLVPPRGRQRTLEEVHGQLRR